MPVDNVGRVWKESEKKEEEKQELMELRIQATRDEAKVADPLRSKPALTDAEAVAKSAWSLTISRVTVYTSSNFVFGMICSFLGPTIPCLAETAGWSPWAFGWWSASQALMHCVSGLASRIIGFVPWKYPHVLLCDLLLWLGGGFALLPFASTSIYTLIGLLSLQIDLLWAGLFGVAKRSSMAQSFSQRGFALSCMATLLLSDVAQHVPRGMHFMFFVTASITAVLSTLSKEAQTPEQPEIFQRTAKSGINSPTSYTLSCAVVGLMAVGAEVTCGTWPITSLEQAGTSISNATPVSIGFWNLCALSRFAIGPGIIRIFNPQPALVVMACAMLFFVCCVITEVFPIHVVTASTALGVLASGAGPSYATSITMAKLPADLSSADYTLFFVAASLGAGGALFAVSRVLDRFGPNTFFPSLAAIAACLRPLPASLRGSLPLSKGPETTPSLDARVLTDVSDLAADTPQPAIPDKAFTEKMPVPKVIWMWWEQGWASAPLVCKACAESWKLSNPDAEVRKLDASMLAELLPEFCSCERLWQLPFAQRADLIRMELLNTYGGVWADATLFCVREVIPWLQSLRRNSHEDDFFFVFDRSDSATWPYDPFVGHNLLISNWFIVSTPHHPLLSAWTRRFKEYLLQPTLHYFGAHQTFRQIVEESPCLHEQYLAMPKVSACHAHTLEFMLGFTTASIEAGAALSEALHHAPMQKLSSKILQDGLFAEIVREGMSTTVLGSMLVDVKLADALWSEPAVRVRSADRCSLAEQEEAARERVYKSWQVCLRIDGAQ